jgi:hypothetical protein
LTSVALNNKAGNFETEYGEKLTIFLFLEKKQKKIVV